MTTNEERDIILNALYYHFGKHRVSLDRLYDYLVKNTEIIPNKIAILIDGLYNTKYVGAHTLIEIEYWITPEGISLIEDYGGFVGRQQKAQTPQTPTVNVYTRGGDIVGSQIGNQSSRDLRLDGINAKNTNINNKPPDTENRYVSSKKTPKTVMLKSWLWANEYKIIAGIISGFIVCIIWYFIKINLDKKYAPQSIPDIHAPAKK
jgi:hypothetical protein